jgi:hypothetical protein
MASRRSVSARPKAACRDLRHVRALYRPGGAKIWLAWDGARPTPTGSPHAEVSLRECIASLGLATTHYVRDHGKPPSVGRGDDPLADFRGPQHVIVEVGADEAARHGWTPGFYRAPVTPDKVRALYGDTVWPRSAA